MKVFESDKTLAFLEWSFHHHPPRLLSDWPKSSINPLSYGHTLIIPKHHGAKLTDIPEEHLTELLPIASRIAKASGAADYNILQNNGRLAHQEVDHVHVHMIPKPNEKEGLGVQWPQQKVEKERLQKLVEEIKSKMWRGDGYFTRTGVRKWKQSNVFQRLLESCLPDRDSGISLQITESTQQLASLDHHQTPC